LNELQERPEAGFILIVDYGFSRAEYYRPERTSGTLSAYAAHRREPDPLQRPGEIDLTAHVDFTTLAETAKDAGLEIAGFTDQHHFMVGLGRLHFPDDAALAATSPKELRAFKTLMHPGLMGQSFQAFCVAKNVDSQPLAGFQFGRDPVRTLFG
jgi:SAM-dependent MidA family methyltransferase